MLDSTNITLIGMPAAGKSTVGVVLAKLMCKSFVDTDLIIQKQTRKRLSAAIGELGNSGFLSLEGSVLMNIDTDNSIIATGGSAVFSARAMEHLKNISCIVYIKVQYEEIERRLGSLERRGVIMDKGQTLRDIYELRAPLYEKYADITIECTEKTSIEEMATRIADLFR